MLTVRPVSVRERLLRSLEQLPPFSPILNRVLASLAREHVCFAEVADLIEKDTVLAGTVLRTVNSALYGFQGAINSVRHAISIAGLHKIRNTVLAASVARMWRHPPAANGWSAARFNLHSAAAATLSDLLVQRLPAAYPEGAFTAGLFHDLGKLLIATELPEEYDAVRSLAERGEASVEECEKEVIGITHAELSAIALSRWHLPLPIQKAVKCHHAPEKTDGWRSTLSQIVHSADECVNRMGITVPPLAPPDGKSPEESLKAVGFGEDIPHMLDEFHLELDVIRSFF